MADFLPADSPASLAGKCGMALSAAGTGARSMASAVTDKGALPMTLVVTVLFGALVTMGGIQVADIKGTIAENKRLSEADRRWVERELERMDRLLRMEIMRAENRAEEASRSAIQAAAAQRETALQLGHLEALFIRRFDEIEAKLQPAQSSE